MKSSQNSTIKWKATLRILSDSFINITGIFAASIKYWIWTIIKTNLTLISTFLQSIGSPPQRACCLARTLQRVGLSAFRLCLLTINTFGGDFFNRYLWHLTLSCYKIILGSWSIYFTVLKETKKEKKMEKREREMEIFDEIVEQTSAMSEVRVHLVFYSVRFAAYVSSSMRRALSIEGLL